MIGRAITLGIALTVLHMSDRVIAGYVQCRALGCLPNASQVQP